jgi:hypothetical protein
MARYRKRGAEFARRPLGNTANRPPRRVLDHERVMACSTLRKPTLLRGKEIRRQEKARPNRAARTPSWLRSDIFFRLHRKNTVA